MTSIEVLREAERIYATQTGVFCEGDATFVHQFAALSHMWPGERLTDNTRAIERDTFAIMIRKAKTSIAMQTAAALR